MGGRGFSNPLLFMVSPSTLLMDPHSPCFQTTSEKQNKVPMDMFEILPEDLRLSIFSRISLKHRNRLKLVSKSWGAFLVRQGEYLASLTTSSSGLLLYSLLHPNDDDQRRNYTTLFQVQDRGRICLLHSSYQLANIYKPRLLSSCNGLVLYHQHPCWSELCVVSPMLLQCRPLPPLHPAQPISFGCIAFSDKNVDVGSSSQQPHFRVIINSRLCCCGACFYIFDSGRWEWKEHLAVVIPDTVCPYARGQSIFHKEKMYTICYQCMAIYDVKNGVVTCVDLPNENVTNVDDDILWVSEGTLYYCVSHELDLFHVWGYDDVNDKWQSVINFARTDEDKKLKLEFVAFNDDFQVLYILVANIVIACSFETRTLTEVWFLTTPPIDSLHLDQFVFNPVDLSVYPAGDVEQHNRLLSSIDSYIRLHFDLV